MDFTTAAALVNELMKVWEEMRLLKLQKRLDRLKLLIIDELGFVPLSMTARNCSSRSSAGDTSADRFW